MSNLGNNPRRIACALCLDGVVFNDAITTITSTSFRCVPFHDFAILIKLVVAGTPTDILFDIEFSEDNVTFYKLMNGPFGDLRYEDAAGNKNEAVFGKIAGKYVRVTATATGTAAQDTFTASVYVLIGK